ncbi:MAG TPA: AMP-binding protein [Acidimicrobiales bacterium]|jgi:fatty-acyl-CoA synthase|nr:AMP-binding protein [Acidimicrobiales bacterium]
MPGWNYADIWETVAQQIPDATAQVHAGEHRTWSDFNRRANGVAQALLDRGVAEQDKVAQYLYNGTEYLESMFAAFKAGLVPINTNYRYADDELVYLWDNADATVVVFHGTFTDTIERIRERVPRVTTWLWVDDGSGPLPEWAIAYEDAAATPANGDVSAPWGRSGDQLLMLYTGGTTGMPKGVMWRQDDQIRSVVGSLWPDLQNAPAADLDMIRERVQGPGLVGMAACPLMHGTGMFTQLALLALGGSAVTMASRHLDIEELLDTIQREKVNQIAIVGDAFAKPIVSAMDAEPGRWDISSLVSITSSGVMWSQEVKNRLLEIHPGMMLLDAFSSSEALGMGSSISTAGNAASTAKFMLGPNAKVITDEGKEVQPGSEEIGRVAVGGFQPIGYYKDEAKTAATFIEFEGKRYSVPGDYAKVEADGSLTLLGRGSVCINTGGEKVFPEEVEEILKLHPAVADAVVVGVPDDKFGEAITAVVEAADGAEVREDDVIGFVKGKLSSYKAPKRVLTIDTIGRAPNAKVDYKRLKAYARESLGV